jgi:lipopolysaccharide transport system permease protein
MPDLLQMVNYALTLLLFLSGIFYSVDTFPEHYQMFFALNPMVTIIESHRDVLLFERWPDFASLASVAGFSLLIGGLGLWIMRRFERVYPRVVL